MKNEINISRETMNIDINNKLNISCEILYIRHV